MKAIRLFALHGKITESPMSLLKTVLPVLMLMSAFDLVVGPGRQWKNFRDGIRSAGRGDSGCTDYRDQHRYPGRAHRNDG